MNARPMTYNPSGWFIDLLMEKLDVAAAAGSVYFYFTNIQEDVQQRKFPPTTDDMVIQDDWTPSKVTPWFTSAVATMLTAEMPESPPFSVIS